MTFATQMTFLARDCFLDRVSPLAHRTALEAEVIEKTHWSPEVLDGVASGRLERYVLYWNAKAVHERERSERP